MLPSLPVIPGKHILALWQAFASWGCTIRLSLLVTRTAALNLLS